MRFEHTTTVRTETIRPPVTDSVFIFMKGITVALGGLVVSVLATGPKVRGFKPGRERWILRVIKPAASLPSEEK
jgi:hypothetical protein